MAQGFYLEIEDGVEVEEELSPEEIEKELEDLSAE